MSMEPKERPYRPIPFAPGYMVSRDGRVARVKPYRVLQFLPFHDVMREVSKDGQARTLHRTPNVPPSALILFRPRTDAPDGTGTAWYETVASHATRLVSFSGDVQHGWVSVRLPLSEDGRVFVRLLMHAPSVAAFLYSDT
jgi:hypothetical protein